MNDAETTLNAVAYELRAGLTPEGGSKLPANVVARWRDEQAPELYALTAINAAYREWLPRVRLDAALLPDAIAALREAALVRGPQQPPAPEIVQPTTQEAVSASPSEELEQPSGGDAAPQEPPPPAIVSPPSAPAYAGTMLQEDRENYLRGVITVRVTQIERNRLEARYDANAQARQRWGFTEYHNASDLGLPITDEVRAAYQEFLVADQWVRATRDHADALRNAAITVGLDLLEAMQTSIEEGWP